MKRMVFVAFMVLIPCASWSKCVSIEYAELKEMTKEQLISEYCKAGKELDYLDKMWLLTNKWSERDKITDEKQVCVQKQDSYLRLLENNHHTGMGAALVGCSK